MGADPKRVERIAAALGVSPHRLTRALLNAEVYAHLAADEFQRQDETARIVARANEVLPLKEVANAPQEGNVQESPQPEHRD